jgi:uncharacterized BrkB/YihY/UPF0761 family membrane protein
MTRRQKKVFVLAALLIVTAFIAVQANLYFLSQHEYPKIRGNHVGLSILIVLIFWLILFILFRKKLR